MKTIIVTGGRDYANRDLVFKVLNFLDPKLVVQGGATGADQIARDWSVEMWKIPHTVKAEWTKYGKSAGPRRNVAMLEKFPEALVVAFPGGDGTANCIKEALKRGHVVLRVEE